MEWRASGKAAPFLSGIIAEIVPDLTPDAELAGTGWRTASDAWFAKSVAAISVALPLTGEGLNSWKNDLLADHALLVFGV
jgi:hypothetical protein